MNENNTINNNNMNTLARLYRANEANLENIQRKLEIKKKLLDLDKAEQINRLSKIKVCLNELILKHVINNEFEKAEQIKNILNSLNSSDNLEKSNSSSSLMIKNSQKRKCYNDDNSDSDIEIIGPEDFIKSEKIIKEIPTNQSKEVKTQMVCDVNNSKQNESRTSSIDSTANSGTSYSFTTDCSSPTFSVSSDSSQIYKIYMIISFDDKLMHPNIQVMYKTHRDSCNIKLKGKNLGCQVKQAHFHLVAKLTNYHCHISSILKRLEFNFFKTSTILNSKNLKFLVEKYNMTKTDYE